MTTNALSRLHERLLREYRGLNDVPRALDAARALGRWLRRVSQLSAAQIDALFPLVELACETEWDLGSPEGAVEMAKRWVELTRSTSAGPAHARCLRDTQALRLLARAKYRARQPDAWLWARVAYHNKLVDRVGGPKQLSDMLGCDPFSPISIAYGRLLGIALPSARRSRDDLLFSRFRKDSLTLVTLLAEGHTVDLTAYHAVIAMTLHAVCARGRPEDRKLVELLLTLDDLARPRDARGEATRLVVCASYWRYLGDLSSAKHCDECVDETLAGAGLRRHLRELKFHRGAQVR